MGSEEQILVGWASASITPDRPVQLAGQYHERISEGVRDPLTATALALETPGEQAIIVSCDLLYTPRAVQECLRELVAPRLAGVDLRKLLLAATHTHTAPLVLDEGWYPPPAPGVMTVEEYAEFLLQRLSAVVEQAWKARRPGGVSWALGRAVIGHNRRVLYDDGTARMYGPTDTPRFQGLEGGEDHGLELLFLWDAAGGLTGVAVNVACPLQVVEHKCYLSVDAWSEIRLELRSRYHEHLHVLPLIGAGGDQSPRDLVRRGRPVEPDMWGEAGMREVALRVADAVDAVYAGARREIRVAVPFRHAVEAIELPARVVTPKEAEEARSAREELAKAQPNAGSVEGGQLRQCDRLLQRYERQAERPVFPVELHVIRLGDVALATNPFELFLDYGLQIKARSRALQTFVVQLACDTAGYLPTARAVAAGGYGTLVTNGLVGPEGGRVLVERTVKAIRGLWESGDACAE